MDMRVHLERYIQSLLRLQMQESMQDDDAKDIEFEVDLSEIKDHPIKQQIEPTTRQAHVNTYNLLQQRRRFTGSGRAKRSHPSQLSHRLLPNWMSVADHFDSRLFCGRFNSDGSVFLSACQDRHIRLFDSKHNWKCFKDVNCRHVGWSVIDVDFSHDSRFLAYSAWSPFVKMCNVKGSYELHEALDFSPPRPRFCLFSIEFSSDDREILGGANDQCLYVYDVERKQRLHRVPAHHDDINTVCFAEKDSNVFYSGSDDGLCKVWDRRILVSSDDDYTPSKPVGVFSGHYEGLTCVTSKGDGRYLITNSKDQSIKLWDVRKMRDMNESTPTLPASGWDYRTRLSQSTIVRNYGSKRADDTSVMTYRGHSVFETLIRCYFSPGHTTGQRYIYTGSHSGNVHIYDILTGETAATLVGHTAHVRDVSWHPDLPCIVSSSWDCSIGRWEYHPDEGEHEPLLRHDHRELDEDDDEGYMYSSVQNL